MSTQDRFYDLQEINDERRQKDRDAGRVRKSRHAEDEKKGTGNSP